MALAELLLHDGLRVRLPALNFACEVAIQCATLGFCLSHEATINNVNERLNSLEFVSRLTSMHRIRI